MTTALYINGIYKSVLQEIIDAQGERNGGESFLQPYREDAIRMLRECPPSPHAPVSLYVSTTDYLSNIWYTAEIIGWEDKREITRARKRTVSRHLGRFQPGEKALFEGKQSAGKAGVNLVTIRKLRVLETQYPTSMLTKVSDGMPLKKRTRSGGWSEVYDLGDLLSSTPQTKERVQRELAEEVAAASQLSDAALARLLRSAPKLPERLQLISTGFRRNPHVIVAVLRRARGVCERCRQKAPFTRRSDGSPFLEVHHWTLLSEGGEDTTENAAALCPNCHREVHHG